MIKVYDKKGNLKGKLTRIDEIEDSWLKQHFEAFVRVGCVLFEKSPGKYGALPGEYAIFVEELDEWFDKHIMEEIKP